MYVCEYISNDEEGKFKRRGWIMSLAFWSKKFIWIQFIPKVPREWSKYSATGTELPGSIRHKITSGYYQQRERERGFELCKAWNPNTRLSMHYSIRRSGALQETKIMELQNGAKYFSSIHTFKFKKQYINRSKYGKINKLHNQNLDRLCGLVVRVLGYRSRGPGSIPGTTRFCEKYWFWNGVHSASWVQLRSYLEEKVVAPF
jgi:hypothetical protein